ncbi:MAG: hypothetical protein ACI8X5_000200 [Planctomycetota bacterium]|jgi:hypothetical protein
MRFHLKLALGTSLALGVTSSVSAQITTLASEGNNIAGVGNITQFDNIAISTNGDWYAEVRTDHSDGSANKVILKNGSVFLREGQAMSAPAGATLKKFDSLVTNAVGDSAHNLTVTLGSDTQGVYWNDKLVKAVGDVVTATGFSAGATFNSFEEVRINNNNQIAAIVEVDDSAIGLPSAAAIIMWDLDAAGNVTAETTLQIEEAPIGSLTANIDAINQLATTWGFNDSGSVIYSITMDTGSGANNQAVALDLNNIVEASFPSPAAGRTWTGLSSAECSINNNGDWVVNGGISGSTADNQLIAKNDVKFVQKGDSLTGMGGYLITSFSNGPVEIANNGDVLWFGAWDDPDTSKNEGLWLNQTMIVQEGVTTVGGTLITKLVGAIDGYHMDPDGQWIVFEATLATGLDGIFRLSIGSGGQPGNPMCFGDGSGGVCPCGNFGGTGQGCLNSSGSGGTLAAFGAPSAASSTLSFQAGSVASNKTCLLVSNTTSSSNPLGDGLGCVGGGWATHNVSFSNGSGSVNWGANQISSAGWVAGQEQYFQVMFRDPSGACGMQFNTTGAYKVTVQP